MTGLNNDWTFLAIKLIAEVFHTYAVRNSESQIHLPILAGLINVFAY